MNEIEQLRCWLAKEHQIPGALIRVSEESGIAYSTVREFTLGRRKYLRWDNQKTILEYMQQRYVTDAKELQEWLQRASHERGAIAAISSATGVDIKTVRKLTNGVGVDVWHEDCHKLIAHMCAKKREEADERIEDLRWHLRERIAQSSATKVARDTGLSYKAIDQMARGTTRRPHRRTIGTLASYLGARKEIER